ncbi:MAG: aminopeptidase N [Lautropia sp.]
MNTLSDPGLSNPTVRRADYAPSDYLTETVELVFDLDPERTLVTATCRYRRRDGIAADAALRLDGEALELLAIALDGVALAPARYRVDDDGLTVIAPPAAFSLTTRVAIRPAANRQLSGLYASRGTLITQCEAQGFRRITYFQDRPDVMATYRVVLRGDAAQFPVLLSNGNLIESGPVSGDGDNRAGNDAGDGVAAPRHQAVWEDPFPKPCYLFALVAGRLEVNERRYRTRSGREVLLQVWSEPGRVDQTVHAMASLEKSIAWDERRFGLELDLDRFMIVATSDFNMGAMENKGLNIFNAKYVFANPRIATDDDFARIESIVGHEYFHNWTGNRVTCRDWFQLTLKEGLTVFRDQEFSADLLAAELGDDAAAAASARAVHRIETVRVLRATQFAEDAGPMAHPIRPDSYQAIDNFYTATVYEKGAEVIRMLQTLVGVDGFRKGMDLYFARHDGQAVTCDDFVAAIADANGRDLSQFLRWYSTAGTPLVLARGDFDAARGRFTLTLRQHLRSAAGRLEPAGDRALTIPIALGLISRAAPGAAAGPATESHATTIELNQSEQRFEFDGFAGAAAPIPSLLRGFSAPVIVHYDYDDEALAFLLANDSDAFNRWEAGQQLTVRAIRRVLDAGTAAVGGDTGAGALTAAGAATATPAAPAAGAPATPAAAAEPTLTALIGALGDALADARLDAGLRQQLLGLPSEGFLTEQIDRIDPSALRAARNAVRGALAGALAEPLSRLIAAEHWREPYRLAVGAVSRRALANAALVLLAAAGGGADAALTARARRQFDGADNMTDRAAALQALMLISPAACDAALADFERQFADEPAVMDKWFMLQATMHRLPGGEPVLERVRRLMRHPAWSADNPNKVRALLNAFCTGNLAEFHRADGAGYALWVEQVLALDASNPQVAARLARALDRHTKFVEPLRAQMFAALGEVARQARSADVREIVGRARDAGAAAAA